MSIRFKGTALAEENSHVTVCTIYIFTRKQNKTVYIMKYAYFMQNNATHTYNNCLYACK